MKWLKLPMIRLVITQPSYKKMVQPAPRPIGLCFSFARLRFRRLRRLPRLLCLRPEGGAAMAAMANHPLYNKKITIWLFNIAMENHHFQ